MKSDVFNRTTEGLLAASGYSMPSDLKKLRFILNAAEYYSNRTGKDLQRMRVLEIGCGWGEISMTLAKLGCRVTAIDVDPIRVEEVRRRSALEEIDNLEIIKSDGRNFRHDETFDFVIVAEVLQYVLDPKRFLESLKRHMADGSILVATIPNGFGPWELKNRLSPVQRLKLYKSDWLRNILGKGPYVESIGEVNYRFYTRKEILDLFGRRFLKCTRFGKSNSILAMISPLIESRFIDQIDVALAECLPSWLASGWFFEFRLESVSEKNQTGRGSANVDRD